MYSLIIADDEAMERYGLEMRIQNHYPDIELLPSAANGIEFMKRVEKYQPDIAIVDIEMPGLTGLEALKILRLKSFSMKIIINTAYDDFSYIQEAISLGASGYLLKPIEHENFSDALNRAIAQIDRERSYSRVSQEKDRMVEQMRTAVEDNIMSSVFLGEPNENSFRLYCQTLSEPFQGGLFASVSPADSAPGFHGAWIPPVEKIIADNLGAFTHYQMKPYQDVLYLFLIPGKPMPEDECQLWARNIAHILSEKILKQTGLTVCFGFSQWKTDFRQMHEAFQECNLAMARGDMIGFFEESSLKSYPRLPLKPLLDAIASELVKEGAITEKIQKQVEQFSALLTREHYALPHAKIAALNLILSLWDKLHNQYGVNPLSFSFIRSTQKLQSCQTQEELCEKIADCIALFLIRPQIKKSQEVYVEKTVLYIEKNYRQDLSLDEIADKIGISSFYLSRLIKQQLKLNFIDLLTEVRIHHAILLIRQGNSTVKEIGKNVGYSNANYFYKVFKKSTGMTVGEMKTYFRQISGSPEE